LNALRGTIAAKATAIHPFSSRVAGVILRTPSDGPKFGDQTRPTATFDNCHTRTLQGGFAVTESRDI